MTIKKRLARSNIAMFVIPVLVAAVLLLIGMTIAYALLEHVWLPRLGITLRDLHQTGEYLEDLLSGSATILCVYAGAVGTALLLTIVLTNVYLTRNLFRHILPNSLAPIIVVGTTSLATYIVLEATLSFLGVGLPTSTVSWGGDISNAQSILRTDPMVLFYPSAALAITVLAFIMMGDAVKDALDPKSRTV